MSDVSEFHRIRRILLCTATDKTKGFDNALEYLDGYRSKLGATGYTGLKAELNFYKRYGREYQLTPAADVGDHTDFTGSIDNQIIRFDVTTNIDFKQFATYEPYIRDGYNYRIAHLDKDSLEVIDIIDLSFPSCECGGFLIPFLMLLPANYDHHGNPDLTNDQLFMQICTHCGEYFVLDRYSHYFMPTTSEFVSQLDFEYEDDISENSIKIVSDYQTGIYKYFRRMYNDSIMGIADKTYIHTGPKGEGFWGIDFKFKHKLVFDEIPEEIECEYDLS